MFFSSFFCLLVPSLEKTMYENESEQKCEINKKEQTNKNESKQKLKDKTSDKTNEQINKHG